MGEVFLYLVYFSFRSSGLAPACSGACRRPSHTYISSLTSRCQVLALHRRWLLCRLEAPVAVGGETAFLYLVVILPNTVARNRALANKSTHFIDRSGVLSFGIRPSRSPNEPEDPSKTTDRIRLAESLCARSTVSDTVPTGPDFELPSPKRI